MDKIHLRLWIITPLLLTAFLMYSQHKREKRIEENIATEILGIEEQKIDEKGLLIEKASKEKEIGSEVYQVGIPYYWKFGVNTDKNDALEGYIPNIKTFKEYYETKNSVLFGTSERNIEDFIKESLVLEEGNYIFSNSIKNESSYFEWDIDTCTEIFYTEVGANVYICDNWVNWLGKPRAEKTYVLTRCNINNKNGYCVFEDYLKEYYNLKTTLETRCFDTDTTEYICEYSDYTKLVEFN